MGHGIAAAALVTATGCILPLDLSVGEFDAGRGAPPVITDQVTPEEFRFSGPISVERNDPRIFSLTLSDNDIDDVLFVRMFVDYSASAPTNFLSDCTAPPNGNFERQASCLAGRLCDPVAQTDTGIHALDVMVSDGEFLSTGDAEAAGQPPFRAIPKGASATIRTWLMECENAQ